MKLTEFLVVTSLLLDIALSVSTIRCINGTQHVHKFSAGDVEFVNPWYPLHNVQELVCDLIIIKDDPNIEQLTIVAEEAVLSQPTDRKCEHDQVNYELPKAPSYLYVPTLCGQEPEDIVLSSGVVKSTPTTVFLPFIGTEFRVTFTTKGTFMGRKFRFRMEKIMKNSPRLAPRGCRTYYISDNAPIIIRSINYPFGSDDIGKNDWGHCFGSADPKKPIKSVTLIPLPISGEDNFRLGPLKGANQGKRCGGHEHLLLGSGSLVNGTATQFCGNRFNAKSGAKVNAKVNFTTKDGIYRVTHVARTKEPFVPAVFRFEVKLEL